MIDTATHGESEPTERRPRADFLVAVRMRAPENLDPDLLANVVQTWINEGLSAMGEVAQDLGIGAIRLDWPSDAGEINAGVETVISAQILLMMTARVAGFINIERPHAQDPVDPTMVISGALAPNRIPITLTLNVTP